MTDTTLTAAPTEQVADQVADQPLGSRPREAHPASRRRSQLDMQKLQQTLQSASARATSVTELAELMLPHLEAACTTLATTWHVCTSCSNVPQPNGVDRTASVHFTSIVEHLRTDVVRNEKVQQWLNECRAASVQGTTSQTFSCDSVRNLRAICIPISAPNDVSVVTIVAMHGDETSSAQIAGSLLATQTSAWLLREEAKHAQMQLCNTAAILELMGRADSSDSLAEACLTIVNELRDHLSSKFVAIGLRTSSGAGRLECVSGLAHFDHASALSRKLESALDETHIRNGITSWPPVEPEHRHQSLAHRQLIETASVEAVISTPLRCPDGKAIGGLIIGGKLPLVIDPRMRHLVDALDEPIGSTIAVARRAQGTRLQRLISRVRSSAWTTRRRAMGAAVLIATLIMLLPLTYKVRCRCVLEPTTHRFAVAPYDGLLENTFVEPGDVVAEDQLLAKMDGREIRWELAGVAAEKHRAAKKHDTHVARHETPDAMMAEAEVARLGTQANLLRYREGNMEIRSPIAGLILSGSIDRRENYPVTVGETLYEIASLNPLRVEVAIPADELAHVQNGMEVQIRLDGHLLEPRSGTISRIRPRSIVRDGENVFIAEVEIGNEEMQLRPGMKGSARIISQRHPLAWNLFHKPWEHLAAWLGA